MSSYNNTGRMLRRLPFRVEAESRKGWFSSLYPFLCFPKSLVSNKECPVQGELPLPLAQLRRESVTACVQSQWVLAEAMLMGFHQEYDQ